MWQKSVPNINWPTVLFTDSGRCMASFCDMLSCQSITFIRSDNWTFSLNFWPKIFGFILNNFRKFLDKIYRSERYSNSWSNGYVQTDTFWPITTFSTEIFWNCLKWTQNQFSTRNLKEFLTRNSKEFLTRNLKEFLLDFHQHSICYHSKLITSSVVQLIFTISLYYKYRHWFILV